MSNDDEPFDVMQLESLAALLDEEDTKKKIRREQRKEVKKKDVSTYLTEEQVRQAWLDFCLKQYNRKFGENRKYTEVMPKASPEDIVEFSDMGGCYAHSAGGTGYLPSGTVIPYAEFVREHMSPKLVIVPCRGRYYLRSNTTLWWKAHFGTRERAETCLTNMLRRWRLHGVEQEVTDLQVNFRVKMEEAQPAKETEQPVPVPV